MAATCSSFPALFGGVSGAAAAPSPPHRTGTGSAAAAAAAFLAAALPRHHPWPLLQSRRWSSHGSCCAGRGETTATAAGLEEDEDGEEEYYYYSDDEEPQPPQQQRKKRSRKTRKRKKSAAAVAAADAEGDPKETTEAASASASPLLLPQLDDVNPVGLGRRYRQAFDDVWRKFSSLASISSPASASLSTISSPLETEVEVEEETVGSMNKARKKKSILLRDLDFGWPVSEFTIPGAEDTTVLVVGATSRVGRILVRKLMLRGYKVKALVRRTDEQVEQMLPRSVSIVVGDVGELSTLQEAVKGCDKIVYCATARSTITADLFRVDYKGVCNVIKAYQDYNNKLAQLRAGKSSKSKLLLAKFKSAESLERWQIGQGNYFPDRVSRLSTKDEKEMDAKFEFTESGEAVFSGYVFTKGGYIDLSTRLSLPLGSTLDRYDGLLLSVGGDGRGYVLILEVGPLSDLSQSRLYFARVNTKMGFCRVRVPFSFFRPVKPDHPPLDPFLIHTLTIRFEPKRQRSMEGQEGAKQDLRSFKLILEYIKALPTGQETNFILVSCTGLGVEPNRREQVLKAKKSGEDSLRRSGLGYTIVRPGPLQEEPGGQRALVFDQGNRISQGISCADVADICVKALHDPTARNKSFDVCYEYVSEEGNELYQLIAHLPNKANNYLTPALSLLETNT